MHICFDLRRVKLKTYVKPVITLGTFDGVHLGHRMILENLKEKASKRKAKSIAVTYEPHPQSIVSPSDAPLILTTLEEKLDLLEEFQIDETVVIDFDQELANYSADRFVHEILVDKLDVGAVVIGYNHGFGKNRTGNLELLKEEGKKRGFEVEVVPPVEYEKKPISSSRIRRSLKQGHFEDVLKMLGHGYPLYGNLIEGRGRGKEMGYPTANLEVNSRKLLPPDGVYAAEAVVDNQNKQGMMYIGTNPTFGQKERSLEIHLFDFSQSIQVGEKLKVNLRSWVREEMKFDSVESLKKRLEQDEIKIKTFFRTN
ncbi:MAG: bifunctional riboflavin kinase/FAD synthetase [candidate division Zixibacteria bacterium]|nr:bifunctional riboflavin kinase/FAD synthetase [candidate division Zixibacteria bacterium]